MAASHSARRVHLINWKYCLGRGGVKILDSLGTKYTHTTRRLLALTAAFGFSCAFLCALVLTPAALAPSGVVATTPCSHNAYHPAATPDDDPQAGFTIRKRVDEVNVLFIATDKHGKFVRDLDQNDFAILDDHKPPHSILNFRRETDLPLHLGLLIDVSGSVD